MERWYVLRTKRRAEAQVSQLLAARGMTCYCPQLARRRNGGRLRVEPLFPGYLFVRLGSDVEHWKLARWSPGVAYLVGTGRSFVPVPDEVMCALQMRVMAEGAHANGGAFAAGDRVLIASGPLEGLEAVFDRVLTPSGRSRVLVEFVSRYMPVEVDLDDLRQANGQGP
ncbi:MAG: transcription/translation regulatory transformer protein RfaH [Chloroflexi bacterium]|nr:transcription/translation regulatory transformer protein RfaH [Chloroflexota bacterium]